VSNGLPVLKFIPAIKIIGGAVSKIFNGPYAVFSKGDEHWPAPGSEDTKLGVLMEREVRHGAAEVYAGVQA
jgi:hypothetical protein